MKTRNKHWLGRLSCSWGDQQGNGLWRCLGLRGALMLFPMLIVQLDCNLEAQTPPPNDNFSNATPLIGENVQVVGSNVGATKEPGEPDHAGDSGGASVWWTWTAPANGPVTIWTEGSHHADGSQLDTLLAVYVGTSVSNLTAIASNDDNPDSAGDLTSLVTFTAVAGTTYDIAVDGLDYPPPDEGIIHLTLVFGNQAFAVFGQAPSWSGLGIDGTTVNSEAFTGDVILLNFWATWCPGCVEEIAAFDLLQTKYASQGFSVIGISEDASPDGSTPPVSLLNSFVANHSVNYPIVMDAPSSRADSAYTIFGSMSGLPTTFIIDRSNGVTRKLVGGPQDESALEGYIKPLIYANLALTATVANGNVVLSWRLTPDPVVVQSSPDCHVGNWTTMNLQVHSNNVAQFVSLPITGRQQFFRLSGQ
jgi:peroxiredoxin